MQTLLLIIGQLNIDFLLKRYEYVALSHVAVETRSPQLREIVQTLRDIVTDRLFLWPLLYPDAVLVCVTLEAIFSRKKLNSSSVS